MTVTTKPRKDRNVQADARVQSYEELRRIVEEVEPVIRNGAARAESEGNVPAEVREALRAAGLFRIWIPASLGGWEVDPVTALRIFEDLSTIDSAAGWLVQMSAAVAALAVFFGEEAVEEMFANPDDIFADTFAAPGQARPVDGGYRVDAHIPWSSNCKNADWFICLAMVMDGSEPKMMDGHPVMKVVVLPTSEIEVVDNWDVTGMKGTGSHDVKISDAFVPEYRAGDMVPFQEPANRAFSPAFGNMTVWHGVASVGVPALGIGRAALDAFVELAGTRTPAIEETRVDKQVLHQYRLGEARAKLEAARSFLYRAISELWESASAGHLVTQEQKCLIQLAASFAPRTACDAVELIAPSAGGSAIREGTPLNRHLRDLRTLTAHAFTKTDRFRDVGALTLGQPAAWGFFAF